MYRRTQYRVYRRDLLLLNPVRDHVSIAGGAAFLSAQDSEGQPCDQPRQCQRRSTIGMRTAVGRARGYVPT